MGQENAESAAGGNPAATDDMLAKLAGAEIDKLLAEATAGNVAALAPGPAPQAAAPTAPRESAAPAANTSTDDELANAAAAEIDELLASKEAESAPPAKEDTHVEDSKPAKIIATHEEAGAPAFYMRVLDLLIAPLEAVPDSLREAMGKVAMVTLFNAVAMLVYLKYFHHK